VVFLWIPASYKIWVICWKPFFGHTILDGYLELYFGRVSTLKIRFSKQAQKNPQQQSEEGK
jgi:hypothetical protein